MNSNKIFSDIATRTGGDIYVGVVGPVRCGKSTFIANFMKSMIIPRIDNKAEQKRVVDELPQGGGGSGIMTTSPKFVPSKAVTVKLPDAATMNLRLIDCVGYMVEGATGHIVDGKSRMVKTPWSDLEIPFEKAAEIGTKKVIKDHSTVAVMMTTDGTVTEIPRVNYINAEDTAINQLKKHGKPFVVAVNSKDPSSKTCKDAVAGISKKHNVTAIGINAEQLTPEDISEIFRAILSQFHVSAFRITMPKWLRVLDANHEIISTALDALKKYTSGVKRLSDNDTSKIFTNCQYFQKLETTDLDVARGVITYEIVPHADLYYKVLTGMAGVAITDERELVAYIATVSAAKHEYDKLRSALEQVEQNGYGVVIPSWNSYQLEEPTLHRNGKNFGIRLRANASSLHIVRVDIRSEVTPTIGSQTQSEEMLKFLQSEYQNNKQAVWETPIFGKSLETIVREDISNKSASMPPMAQVKMRRTLNKIVNNGKGGVICILL